MAQVQLALALLSLSIEPALSVMAHRPEEGMGLGFDTLLRGAAAAHDGLALVASAAAFEISAEQLAFLRARLSHAPNAAAAAGGGGAPRRGLATRAPSEPGLSGIEVWHII